MTNFGKITFRIRVFDIGVNINPDVALKYDYLDDLGYENFVEEENLICCQITCNCNSIQEVIKTILPYYMGMTYNIVALDNNEKTYVSGGFLSDEEFEYIADWLDNHKTLFDYDISDIINKMKDNTQE